MPVRVHSSSEGAASGYLLRWAAASGQSGPERASGCIRPGMNLAFYSSALQVDC